jgi:hypothetical protein
VLEGPAGIGNTTARREGVAMAGAAGFRVLAGSPEETEQQLAYSALSDLLAHVVVDADDLPAPQRRALEVALLVEDVTRGAAGRKEDPARARPHALPSGCRPNGQHQISICRDFYGIDGTRTRDLRRAAAGIAWSHRVRVRAYEAWLRNRAGVLVPIGTFNEGRRVTLWAGVSPKEFPTLTVTRERADGAQASSGQKVLVGTAVGDSG